MRSFESFKAKREKMDPSSRKLSKSQWQQAYAAYKSSRERVHGRIEEGGATANPEGDKLPPAGMHAPTTLSESGQLRGTIRENSAYSELRTLVDLLALIVMGLIGLVALFQGIALGNLLGALLMIGGALINLIIVFVVKLLIHVLIDIPDVALYRLTHERAERAELFAASESET